VPALPEAGCGAQYRVLSSTDKTGSDGSTASLAPVAGHVWSETVIVRSAGFDRGRRKARMWWLSSQASSQGGGQHRTLTNSHGTTDLHASDGNNSRQILAVWGQGFESPRLHRPHHCANR
jgi:hypothetical protein